MNNTITRMTAASCPDDGMQFGLPTLGHWRNQAVISLPIYNSTSATLRSRVRNGAAKQAAPPRGEPR